MDRTAAHQALVAEILADCANHNDVELTNNPQAVATPVGTSRTRRFGCWLGGADLLGPGPGGVYLEVEVKTGSATTSHEQRAHALEMAYYRGIHIVVRSMREWHQYLEILRDPDKREELINLRRRHAIRFREAFGAQLTGSRRASSKRSQARTHQEHSGLFGGRRFAKPRTAKAVGGRRSK